MGLLYTCDLFKTPVALPFNGKEQLSTKFGFILSLGLFFFLLNSTLHSDLFLHKKPTISLQTDSQETYGRMAFSRANFTLVTRIADFLGVSTMDLSYFYFNVSFTFMNFKTESTEKNKFFMKICEPSDFSEKDLALNISRKAFCISQKEAMILEGNINSGKAQYAVVHLSRCDKYSSNYYKTTCKNKTETDIFFQNKLLFLYYTNNKFDLTNFQNPVNSFLDWHMTYIYPQIKKTTFIQLQKTVIQTEIGEFCFFRIFLRSKLIDANFENPDDNVEESFSVGRIDSDFTIDEKMVHEFFILTESSTQIMRRRYQNLQDLLAILGGISSTYLLIANFFLSNYKKFIVVVHVLNNLLVFEKNENEFHKEKTQQQKSLAIKSRKPNFKEKKTLSSLFPASSSRLPKKARTLKNLVDMNSKEILDPKKNIEIDMLEIKSQKTIKSWRSVFNENKGQMSSENKDKDQMSPKFLKSLKKAQFSRISKIPLKLGYLAFLRYQIKKKLRISLNKEEEALETGVRTYLAEMDILNILRKIKEITHWKSMISAPSQITVFDSNPKPFTPQNF